MERADVVIIGGGPAGSTCAAELVRAGYDVLVVDKAKFPRDKVCAGWITTAVVRELALDIEEYGRSRTIDPIHGFRVGQMGSRVHVHLYDAPVSYGIRRCEFDTYLLQRSGARLALGRRVERVSRRDGKWLLDGEIEADVLVGAGGHFCPVARVIGGKCDDAVIAAEEVEFAAEEEDLGSCAVESGIPELYFTPDLTGYGWAFRKNGYLNIGLGVRAHHGNGSNSRTLKERIPEFLDYLVSERRISRHPKSRMSGHAYVLNPDSRRPRFGDGFVLVGDAAGLAYDRSGEGIRCAVESGLLAAETIGDALAKGSTSATELGTYGREIEQRFGAPGQSDALSHVPAALRHGIASALMQSSWFSRHILLERWFLHTDEPEIEAPSRSHRLSARAAGFGRHGSTQPISTAWN